MFSRRLGNRPTVLRVVKELLGTKSKAKHFCEKERLT